MGCFSFLCTKSEKPGNSSSFGGNPVHLFLLKKGKVIEHMYGNYDSYGRVFSDEKGKNNTSFEWKTPWNECCDLMFDADESNGIALIHDAYWKEGDPYPTTRSDGDPDQGWNEGGSWKKVSEPYHKFNF